MENSLEDHDKSKIELSDDSETLLLGMCLQERKLVPGAIPVSPCSSQRCSQKPRWRNRPSVQCTLTCDWIKKLGSYLCYVYIKHKCMCEYMFILCKPGNPLETFFFNDYITKLAICLYQVICKASKH